ncbi:MAG: type II secretion system F family protein [Bryobacteraceae bacterium]|nr:type II secretion system F family protein [Bryobacteraceae bacterium]
MNWAHWLPGVFFATVMFATVVAGYLAVYRKPRRAGAGTEFESTEAPTEAPRAIISRAFNRIGEAIPNPVAEQATLRKRLLLAGYRWPSAVTMFHGIRVASGLALAGIVGWTVLLAHGETVSTLIPVLCGAGFGYLLPDRALEARIRARARRIRRGIPPALDLLVLALEAGQSLDQSLHEVAKALGMAYPDLCEEFLFARLEMRAGKSRQEALRHLAARSPDAELGKLTALLIDAERFGTSLGPALRTHSRYLRTRNRHRAQEAARKLGAKLVLPVFFLIFPVVLLVTLGPAVIQFRESLKTLFSGL